MESYDWEHFSTRSIKTVGKKSQLKALLPYLPTQNYSISKFPATKNSAQREEYKTIISTLNFNILICSLLFYVTNRQCQYLISSSSIPFFLIETSLPLKQVYMSEYHNYIYHYSVNLLIHFLILVLVGLNIWSLRYFIINLWLWLLFHSFSLWM